MKNGLLLLVFIFYSSAVSAALTALIEVDQFLDENISQIQRGPAATDEKVTNVNKPNKKIIYTYKQYEKFDFDDLNIEGAGDVQNDLSIPPIHEKQFPNQLPYRRSFNFEIKKGIERVR